MNGEKKPRSAKMTLYPCEDGDIFVCDVSYKRNKAVKDSKGLWLLNSLVIWCKMGWCVGDVFS